MVLPSIGGRGIKTESNLNMVVRGAGGEGDQSMEGTPVPVRRPKKEEEGEKEGEEGREGGVFDFDE